MYNLMSSLRIYIKRQDVVIDNAVFRLHTRFTTVLLLTCSMMVTWTQYVDQPIRCMVSNNSVPRRVINTYCWIMTTFAMPDAFHRNKASVAYPGVANNFDNESDEKHYNYYQWVCFVLFFQAMMCYFPRWLWKKWENGLMATIACGLRLSVDPDRTIEEEEQKKRMLIAYLIRNLNLHNWYVFRYWFCEVLCFVNVILQMFLMNWFLNGDFLTYGWDVLTFDEQDQEDRTDNIIFVFPRMTKCTFRKFGVSGTIEKHDALCMLPLNIVNEKTYIFLWFWYIILAILTAGLVIYRLVLICFPRLRQRLMYTENRVANANAVETVSQLSIGDWWLVCMIGRNVDRHIYAEIVGRIGRLVRFRK